MACAKGSRDRQNNKGESGHPCLVPRCKGNGGEIILPVMTNDAAGEWYNVLKGTYYAKITFISCLNTVVWPQCVKTTSL